MIASLGGEAKLLAFSLPFFSSSIGSLNNNDGDGYENVT